MLLYYNSVSSEGNMSSVVGKQFCVARVGFSALLDISASLDEVKKINLIMNGMQFLSFLEVNANTSTFSSIFHWYKIHCNTIHRYCLKFCICLSKLS